MKVTVIKWKVQLTTAINFISSKDVEEEHMSDNIKFMPYDN